MTPRWRPPSSSIAACLQPTTSTYDASYMSLPIGGDASDTVKRAGAGAPHGRYAAFAAAPRVVTAVTATEKDIARRPGRKIFSDE